MKTRDCKRMHSDSPADLEKQVESSRRTSDTLQKSSDGGDPRVNPDELGAVHHEGKLVMTEAEALDRARRFPEDVEPIYLCYSVSDRDNPRNWGKAKRWGVTCLVCWFNVLT